MTQPNSSHSERPFMYAFVVVLRHWRFLAVISVCTIVVSGITAFMLPKVYRSTASFLPPQRQSGLLESVTSGLSSTLKNIGLGKTSAGSAGVYSYLSILESRTLGERIIAKFNLQKLYGGSSMEGTLRQLNDNVEFAFEDQGHITVSVEDTDPKRAAEMANTYVQYLNELNMQLGTTEAHSNLVFLESQYKDALNNLRSIEDSFVVFQKRTKIISLPDQSKAMMTTAAAGYAQVMYQQVNVAVMERTLGPDDADVQLAKAKLQELQKVLGENAASSSAGGLLPGTKDISKEGMEYMRLYRDYEIYTKFIGFLLPMYQQAKVDEHRQTQAVVLLDEAKPPEYKAKPKRSIIILLSTFSVLALGIIFVLVRDRFAIYRVMYSEEWEDVRRSFQRKG
jgi:tyrosine-protein kinase Etk/Wzc